MLHEAHHYGPSIHEYDWAWLPNECERLINNKRVDFNLLIWQINGVSNLGTVDNFLDVYTKHLASGETLYVLGVFEYEVLVRIQDVLQGLHAVIHDVRRLE
jgi:hypothetical protein